MKSIFTFLFLLFSVLAQTQIVTIPDANFKAALIEDGVDTNSDGEIQVTEAEAITELDVHGESIADLTGIASFINITSLDCRFNDLTNLDLSANTVLITLNCRFNDLTNLDLSANTALITLDCKYNDLSSLDLSTNTALSILDCNGNDLSSLDLSANTALTNLDCSYNDLPSLDLSTNTALIVLDCHYNWSDFLSLNVSSCTNLTTLDCSYNNLSTLDVSLNTSLSYLNCKSNDITSIDLSALTNLTFFDGGYNSLATLDISSNTSLVTIDISSNNLTSIDLSNNIAVTDIDISYNDYAFIDFTNNILLEKIRCSGVDELVDLDLSSLSNLIDVYFFLNNKLESINIKNGNNTAITDSHFKATNNPLLTCIQVDNAAWSIANWTDVDPITSFSEDCSVADQTYVPDDNFEQALIDLGFDTTLDDYVTTNNINSIINLDVHDKSIADLTGIEDFTVLKALNVNGNLLSHINLDDNLNLEGLQCNGNNLSGIGLNNNTELNFLKCAGNQIEELDLSNNSDLVFLNSSANQLTSLDLRNGNNTAITNFFASDNPNLTCIYVDDATYSTTNWTNIDGASSFVEDEYACASLSIEQIVNSLEYNLYPNPITDVLTIKSVETIIKVFVFDSMGKQVMAVNDTTISFTNLPNGLYLVKILSKNGNIITKKIIKK